MLQFNQQNVRVFVKSFLRSVIVMSNEKRERVLTYIHICMRQYVMQICNKVH